VVKKGPRWGLDFTGGNILEIRFQNPPSIEEIRKVLGEKGIPSFEIQSILGEGTFIIRTKPQAGGSTDEKDMDAGKRIQTVLEEAFAGRSPALLRKEYVGPTVGKHLGRQTLIAFLLTFAGIIIYVAFRFHSGIWGVAGVLALVHDVLATVGIFSLTDKEVTVTIVAALLTIAGYSINDTIVIFDYMRERLRLRRTESLAELIDKSLNETLSRTIITTSRVTA
jgi:preprotein translocase subunit SecF